MPGLRHGGNFAGFRETTTPAQIEHDDASYTRFEKITERPTTPQCFRGTDRRYACFRIALETAKTIHLDRVFVPERLERREFMGDLHGG
ncbi:hypothetical protein D3C80_2061230 [compost metagenome]